MSLPFDNVYVFAVTILLGSAMLAVLCMFGHQCAVAVYDRLKHRGEPQAVERRHCRYCTFGRSSLREESVRLEGDDLVEVKCFVCGSCGLPQWSVQRSPVLKKAA